MDADDDVDAEVLRELAPRVLDVLVRRGADFATAEDAVQDALVKAITTWPDDPPRDPKGWLITTAWHAFIDRTRSESSRRRRELAVDAEPGAGAVSAIDDTLRLYFLCAHPTLTPASAVALTLRALGGLTTAQIAHAYLVPEATMAQRISRAKRAVADVEFDRPGDLATVMHVLYLVFNEGYSGDVDLAAEAIRLTRQLNGMIDDPEVAGLLALMLLHHARRAARTRPDGSLVTLAEQDRTRWDVALITEGVATLQWALARDRLGPYQAQAAIAALHADAPHVEETDWVQIVAWYDELLRLTDTPVVRLNRAVAVGEADGAPAGLAALAQVSEDIPRHSAVAAHLHERNGDLRAAARLYAHAARHAPNLQERAHQTRQAARVNQLLREDRAMNARLVAASIDAQNVTLQPLALGDADEMVAVLADESLYTFTGGGPPTLATLRDRYRRQIAGSRDPAESWCNWIIRTKHDGRAVGYVQATVIVECATVAWVVGVRDQGRGIAIEAASAMCAWLLDHDVRSVEAHIHPDHTASQAVAARVGLHLTGILDDDGEEIWTLHPSSGG